MSKPRSIPRLGEQALLSVTHPILGTELSVNAQTIRITPEQYFALVDELCSMAFCCPGFGPRVSALAQELGIREVVQYVAWMNEADKNRSWKENTAA